MEEIMQTELEWSYDGVFWEPVRDGVEFGDGVRDIYIRSHGNKLSLHDADSGTQMIRISGDDIRQVYAV